MKKWMVIITATMALLLLALSPMAALAQSEDEVMADSRPSLKGALAIVAPRIAGVGKEISMTVFLRATQEPFEGAGVWALTRDEAEVLREEMAALREDGSVAAADKDYEALVDIHGAFLGRTDEDGKLYHTFVEAGGYLLVTVKRGYFPGFTPIGIRDVPESGPMPEQLSTESSIRSVTG